MNVESKSKEATKCLPMIMLIILETLRLPVLHKGLILLPYVQRCSNTMRTGYFNMYSNVYKCSILMNASMNGLTNPVI